MELSQLYKKQIRVFDHGEAIIHQGDYGEHIFMVKSGAVEITREMENGQVFLAMLGEGDFFGEMALFDHLPRSATVKAWDRTEIYALSKDDLIRGIKEFPEIALELIGTMSRRLRKTDNEIVKLLKQEEVTKAMLMDCLKTQCLI